MAAWSRPTEMTRLLLLLILGLSPVVSAQYQPSGSTPPTPNREFRAAWVATVHNIDWPSRPGLSQERQKLELTNLLDLAAKTGLNALIFQVRPEGDAVYESTLEPSSYWVSGKMGRSPGYDPLLFAVNEAHLRGLELHAWFNPFRARATRETSAAPNHLSQTNPEWMLPSGSQIWANPGIRGVQERAIAVMRDVLSRYDVDGIHMDDYFYPYPKKVGGRMVPQFDDSTTFRAYQKGGGRLEVEDWRRSEIDGFMQRLYGTLKQIRPTVKFGVSPFGIWRPGNPSSIEADLDAYRHISADSRKWLQEGWVDYFTPQLYWRIGDRPHSFSTLTHWWAEQNTKGRHLWPGIASSRIESEDDPGRPASEIGKQIGVTREQATGHVHWSFKAIAQDRDGLRAVLANAYAVPAIPPASPWLAQGPAPTAPSFSVQVLPDGRASVRFDRAPSGVRWRLIQLREKEKGPWTSLRPMFASFAAVDLKTAPFEIAVRLIDAAGQMSPATVLSRQ